MNSKHSIPTAESIMNRHVHDYLTEHFRPDLHRIMNLQIVGGNN
ncbi:hypothetical protein TBK1r_42630 [Stieleria magnilauensis]|uniref:Uncharacterized protein n=1 Tax=Stieleria magnilauensis TaxID=2527963 RepID=A0ABX5XZP6_9BACT|nr:hypothetical protein TBK1r_42630 [Planctomycetes bacterium TBK1r]